MYEFLVLCISYSTRCCTTFCKHLVIQSMQKLVNNTRIGLRVKHKKITFLYHIFGSIEIYSKNQTGLDVIKNSVLHLNVNNFG